MISDVTLPVFIRFAPLLVLLALAAAIDAKQRRIPNWLTFGLIITGLVRGRIQWRNAGNRAFAPGHRRRGGYSAGTVCPRSTRRRRREIDGRYRRMASGAGPVFAVFLLQAVIGLGIVLVQSRNHAGRVRAACFATSAALIAAGFAYASELGLENAVQSGKRCRSIDRPLPYAVPVFVATVTVLALSRLVGS